MAQEARAKSILGMKPGLHCCQFVAYCIYGDKNKNQDGAQGWQNWGSPATKNDARVIWQKGHVGFVANGKVYYSQGVGGQHKCKTLDQYIKYVVDGKNYKFRK